MTYHLIQTKLHFYFSPPLILAFNVFNIWLYRKYSVCYYSPRFHVIYGGVFQYARAHYKATNIISLHIHH